MVVLLDGVATLALLKSKDVLLVTELSLSVETKPSFSVIDFVYRWRRRSRRRRRSSPRRRRRWRSAKVKLPSFPLICLMRFVLY
ncbi:hypothetical protein IGI04_039429 [Brassica rapa subsp. trilocularis]|uniref:Uncharacterized protein n=1 Tax=Brassica rapa subsp. trilocularis TaxID=1813537 RepID=A0ABQ7KPA1_BRACM|nr:hypothetical protein IGI04_039429 [Brassica rapa subsp. trilocularis]